MKNHSNAIDASRKASSIAGLLWGGLGVVAFSFTFPATRLAAGGGFDPAVIGLGRAVIAGVLAAALLAITHSPIPAWRLWGRLAIVVVGVVIGFPLFTSLALHDVPAAHGAVITGLLPAATAIMAVIRAGERPSALFWLAALAGLAAVLTFAAAQGAGRIEAADAYILIGVALAGLGYAEGAALAREMASWRVICWALVLSLPILTPIVAWRLWMLGGVPQATPAGWFGFSYVSVISMLLGFFAWYRGLAKGGVARVGQLQLAQPLLTLLWSALFLGETVGAGTLIAAAGIMGCVVLTQLTRVSNTLKASPFSPRGRGLG